MARILVCIAVGLAGLVSAPALFNAPIYDDTVLIFDNAFVRGTSHLVDNLTRDFFYSSAGSGRMGYWRPVMKLLFMAQYAAFGGHVIGYHVVSIVALTSLVLLGFTIARRCGLPGSVAGVGAVVYASHPVNASAVSTITSQSDLFVAVFALACVYAYLRFRAGGGGAWLAAALGAETLALGCKEIAVLTPALVVAAELVVHPAPTWRAFLRRSDLVAFLAPVALYAALRVGVDIMPIHAERGGGGLAAIFTAAKIACSAQLRCLLPTAWLPLLHQERPQASFSDFAVWCVPALALVAGSLVLFVRQSALRLWITLSWVPLLPIVVGESMIHTTDSASFFGLFDRWLVLPALAASFVWAILLDALRARLPRRGLRAVLTIAIAALVLTQGLLSLQENRSYRNENARAVHLAEIYREHDVQAPYAREIIVAADAILAERRNDAHAAAIAYAELVALAPNDLMRHYNLAVTLMRAGDIPRAHAAAYLAYHGRSADGHIQLESNDSWLRRRPERAFLLATLSARLGDDDAAERYFEACLAQRPDYPGARQALMRIRATRAGGQ